MAGTKKQVKGKALEASGEAKRATGKATNNRSLEAKGVAEKAKGKVKSGVGRLARNARGASE